MLSVSFQHHILHILLEWLLEIYCFPLVLSSLNFYIYSYNLGCDFCIFKEVIIFPRFYELEFQRNHKNKNGHGKPKPDVVANTCNSSTGKVKAGDSGVHNHPQLHGEFKVCLSYLRPCVKNKSTNFKVCVSMKSQATWNIALYLWGRQWWLQLQVLCNGSGLGAKGLQNSGSSTSWARGWWKPQVTSMESAKSISESAKLLRSAVKASRDLRLHCSLMGPLQLKISFPHWAVMTAGKGHTRLMLPVFCVTTAASVLGCIAAAYRVLQLSGNNCFQKTTLWEGLGYES